MWIRQLKSNGMGDATGCTQRVEYRCEVTCLEFNRSSSGLTRDKCILPSKRSPSKFSFTNRIIQGSIHARESPEHCLFAVRLKMRGLEDSCLASVEVIDPAIVSVLHHDKFFSFLKASRAAGSTITSD